VNILNLPNFAVHEVRTSPYDYEVVAIYTPDPRGCPHCGVVKEAGTLYRHGYKKQNIWDVPTHGKRCRIELHRQRWKCRECGRTFLHPIPELDDEHSMTTRAVAYIERQSVRTTSGRLKPAFPTRWWW
jgi:transposase